MHASALKILQERFGYHQFRDRQEEVISTLIEGRDALVLMPTGGGKSLCYQIPSLLRDGVGVIVSPLIALMQDQVDALRQNGISAVYLNSTQSSDEVRHIEQGLERGEYDMLYIAPERLLLPRTLDLIGRLTVALFAIDEAHCVSQWGHDFRPEYIRLSELHRLFPHIPRIALTATADTATRKEIISRLALAEASHFVSGFDRPNIRYRIMENQGNSRERLLRFIQSEHAGEAGIVYCLSRRKVEDTAVWLSGKGINALPYHAGLASELRQQHQQRFLREDGVVIVATIAFGMGIDKPDVRFVAHLSLPKSIEAYYQETGRAGRDGDPADAWMCYGLQDVITLRQMQAQSDADEQHKRVEQHKLNAMLGLCETLACRRETLLRYFGDEHPDRCGNCDTCLDPPESWDASVAAQKALSCVYRTEQRFGVTYLIEVLLGSKNSRIEKFGHQQISTYGIGSELNQQEWRALYRQLISMGLLAVDIEGHGALHLTESSRPVLRGEKSLILRKLRKGSVALDRKAKRKINIKAGQQELWDQLRALRKNLADEQEVPAFTIFHDATLVEMMEILPTTLSEMNAISGVGERKLERYGSAFLELLNGSISESDTRGGVDNSSYSDTEEESLQLFRLGMDAEGIASQRGMKVQTVLSHLCRAIAEEDAEVCEVTGLTPAEITEIDNHYQLQEDKSRLKPLFDSLEGRYSYEVLRCVRAAAGD